MKAKGSMGGKHDYPYRKHRERFTKEQAPICKQFGCGKLLSPTEYLFSEYCFKHARDRNTKDEGKDTIG